MQELLSVAAMVVAAGGILMILMVLLGPYVRRHVVILRLRRGLYRIDDVLAEWERDASGERHSP
jgi:hypothetical protein